LGVGAGGVEKRFEVEAEEAEGEDIGPTLGSAAAALSLPKASRDRVVSAKTAAFLDEQTAVLRLQKEHLHEQRELQLSHLKWRRFSDWMKAALQLSSALVAVAIVAGVGAAIWDAAHANSVVVDAFRSPPGLSAKGLDGSVVASGLIDELSRMQVETRVTRAKRGVTDAWSGDIKVEVPETGVSIGEMTRNLHRWLGHETHVTGDLVENDAGLTLTVRGDGVAARSFNGPASDLPKLTTEAAEYVYGEAEPYFAATYLIGHYRDAEALALVQAKYDTVKAEERPYLLNSWGNALLYQDRPQEALARYQEAARLNPDYWAALSNIVTIQLALGREEDAWRSGAAMVRRSRRGRPGQKADENYFNYVDRMDWNLPGERAAFLADMEAHAGVGSNNHQRPPDLADAAVRMHEPVAAELYLQTSADVAHDPFAQAMIHFVRGWAALDRGDGAAAARELEAFATAYASPGRLAFQVPGYACWLAQAEEMAGHPDKADAALRAGGHYLDCWRFKADILDHRGDWPGAQKAYADAVALAPDLPAGWYSWGLALARHGDLAGAEAKFAAANARGPHWADPLKAWGDVLAAQHRLAEAELKYAEAVRYAPRWMALHMAYGNALRAEGKYGAAIAQYQAVTEAAGHG
jgi:tetratricopeptide (TPR) repeat protein